MKKIITLLLITLLAFLLAGCFTTSKGLGTDVPANVTGTQGWVKSTKKYDKDGQLKVDIREAKFKVNGENDISDMLLTGSLEEGDFSVSAEEWDSKKTDLVKASGEREAGNIEAAGKAAGAAVNKAIIPDGGFIGPLPASP